MGEGLAYNPNALPDAASIPLPRHPTGDLRLLHLT